MYFEQNKPGCHPAEGSPQTHTRGSCPSSSPLPHQQQLDRGDATEADDRDDVIRTHQQEAPKHHQLQLQLEPAAAAAAAVNSGDSSRMTSLAVPGAVCVSDVALVESKSSCDQEDRQRLLDWWWQTVSKTRYYLPDYHLVSQVSQSTP